MKLADDTRREIERATELSREIKQLEGELENCKRAIRKDAAALFAAGGGDLHAGGSIELGTAAGVCTVTFVRDRFGLAEKQTAEGLRHVFSEKLWSSLFEFQPALRPNAAGVYEDLSAEDRRRVDGLLVFAPMAARVVLPK